MNETSACSGAVACRGEISFLRGSGRARTIYDFGRTCMEAMRALCGCGGDESRLGSIRGILGNEIERYGGEVARMLDSNDESAIALYGCFAARKMLETGCTALLSAIDPLRLLVLREFQVKGAYDLGERHPASIDWRSDIVSSEAAQWRRAVSPDKFVRALLGGHAGEVTWCHAISQLPCLDEEVVSKSSWIEELVSQCERHSDVARAPDGGVARDAGAVGMLAYLRQSAQHHFSTLSKGVHLEFIVNSTALFDIPTVTETMRGATKILTQLGFLSNLIDCRSGALAAPVAGDLVAAIERTINGNR